MPALDHYRPRGDSAVNGNHELVSLALVTALTFLISLAAVLVLRHYGVFTIPKLPAGLSQ